MVTSSRSCRLFIVLPQSPPPLLLSSHLLLFCCFPAWRGIWSIDQKWESACQYHRSLLLLLLCDFRRGCCLPLPPPLYIIHVGLGEDWVSGRLKKVCVNSCCACVYYYYFNLLTQHSFVSSSLSLSLSPLLRHRFIFCLFFSFCFFFQLDVVLFG